MSHHGSHRSLMGMAIRAAIPSLRFMPFRTAYRSVADELKRDALTLPMADPADLIRRRRSTGGMGNLGLPKLRTRLRHCLRQNEKSQVQFRSAIDRLLQPMPTHDSDTHNPK